MFVRFSWYLQTLILVVNHPKHLLLPPYKYLLTKPHASCLFSFNEASLLIASICKEENSMCFYSLQVVLFFWLSLQFPLEQL
jgi:hypothetical protein